MEFNEYFDPVQLEEQDFNYQSNKYYLHNNVHFHISGRPLEPIGNFNIAIIGIPEDRCSSNFGCSQAPDKIRQKLYRLFKPTGKIKIVDLGNLKIANQVNDSYFATRDVIYELLSNNVIPLIIGGSQDLTYACYLAYEKLKKSINMVSVDSKFDLNDPETGYLSESFFSKIILHKSKYLFNYTNLGYQSYFVSQDNTDLLNKFLFDSYRLGFLQSNLKEIEPVLRDADIVSFDIGAIRQSDAPGNSNASPNGFYGEEACQVARYAGLSDRISLFGIFEVNPEYDTNDQTVHLAAQIIWHFIDGFCQRKKEFPADNAGDYKKFIVSSTNPDQGIIFYKSQVSERWWLEVPCQDSDKKVIVACSYDDYQRACNHELPDRWWKTYQKVN